VDGKPVTILLGGNRIIY